MRAKQKPGSVFYVPAPLGVKDKAAIVMAPEHKTRVQQSFKTECDINHIVETFSKTGQLPPGPPPVFGDARYLAMSLAERVIFVRSVKDQFEKLPASIRKLAPTPEALAALDPSKLSEAIKAEVAARLAETPESRMRDSVSAAVKAALTPPAAPDGPTGPSSKSS